MEAADGSASLQRSSEGLFPRFAATDASDQRAPRSRRGELSFFMARSSGPRVSSCERRTNARYEVARREKITNEISGGLLGCYIFRFCWTCSHPAQANSQKKEPPRRKITEPSKGQRLIEIK